MTYPGHSPSRNCWGWSFESFLQKWNNFTFGSIC